MGYRLVQRQIDELELDSDDCEYEVKTITSAVKHYLRYVLINILAQAFFPQQEWYLNSCNNKFKITLIIQALSLVESHYLRTDARNYVT
jgi:hypothetical protein